LLGAYTAAGLALAIVLTGCSKDDPIAGKPGAGTNNVSDKDPNKDLKEGGDLQAALVTKKDVPAGFKIDPNVTRDSADTFAEPEKAKAPVKKSCADLGSNIWISGSGVVAGSFAQIGFTDPYSNEIDAMIESYRGEEATKVMANMRKLFGLCSTYKTKVEGVGKLKVKVVTKNGPKVGDESIRGVMTSSAWEGGITLIAVRSGNEIVSVLSSATKNDGGQQGAKLTRLMINRLTKSE
jgi:hypothetical protein